MAKVTFAELASGPSRLKRKMIQIEEWPDAEGNPGEFYIVEISGDAYQSLKTKVKETTNKYTAEGDEDGANLIVASLWLNSLLSDVDGENPSVEFLMTQSLRLLTDLSRQALEFNGISNKDQEELAKNFEAQKSATSGS